MYQTTDLGRTKCQCSAKRRQPDAQQTLEKTVRVARSSSSRVPLC